jgi:sigma-B regulation protein RsbU (phosphoserine phosphatase)
VASNLWTDLEALQRLARSERVARRNGHRARPRGQAPATSPAPGQLRYDIQARDITARLASGDFFDFFPLSDSEIALVLADVSGKGVPAAVLRGVSRSVIRSLAAVEDGPAAMLTRLDEILSAAELGSMFVTLFFGTYDVYTGGLRYANAGHPIPFRIGSGQVPRPFGEVTGPILGILDSAEYGEKEERLETGERLVLFTDGVSEARDPRGEYFAPNNLLRCLQDLAGASAKRLCESLGRSVQEFVAGSPQDDATVVVLERRL